MHYLKHVELKIPRRGIDGKPGFVYTPSYATRFPAKRVGNRVLPEVTIPCAQPGFRALSQGKLPYVAVTDEQLERLECDDVYLAMKNIGQVFEVDSIPKALTGPYQQIDDLRGQVLYLRRRLKEAEDKAPLSAGAEEIPVTIPGITPEPEKPPEPAVEEVPLVRLRFDADGRPMVPDNFPRGYNPGLAGIASGMPLAPIIPEDQKPRDHGV